MSNWSYTRVGAKDGKGIQSITEYYKLSANTTETFSASTILTWSTSVSQPTSANPYLLNAELVVYSDGTKEYKAPHVASRYVTDGQAGRGIAGITEYYLATSASSGVTRSTSGWTKTIQTMTSTKKYLWNYEETTYTDDSDPSYTNPCIIGVYGDNGAKALQANRNWTSTFTTVNQTATCNTTDFNRTPVVGDTFTNLDGSSNTGTWQVTAISGTTVTIKLLSFVNSKGATGAKGADASQIGENLLHDSKLLGSVYDSSYPYYKSIDNGIHTANALNGFTQTYCNNSSGTGSKDFLDWRNIKGFTLGDKYTLSFWAKGSGKMYIYWYGESGYVTVKRTASSDGQAASTSFNDGNTTFTLTSNWQQYWVTYQLNSSGDNTKAKYILFRAYAGAQIYIAGCKFEKGSAATAWVPHIDEQNLTVTNTSITYQQSTSGTTVPTGTWNTTPPSATAGQYMWTKTVVTYSNGNTSTSYAVSRNGSNSNVAGPRAPKYRGPGSAPTTDLIAGDWYLNTSDGKVYVRAASSWTAQSTTTPNQYHLDCINDMISLLGTTTNATVKSNLETICNAYVERLLIGTAFVKKLFTSNIEITTANDNGVIKTSNFTQSIESLVSDTVRIPKKGFQLWANSDASDSSYSEIDATRMKALEIFVKDIIAYQLKCKSISVSGGSDQSTIHGIIFNSTTSNNKTYEQVIIDCVTDEYGGFIARSESNPSYKTRYGYDRIEGLSYINSDGSDIYLGTTSNRKKVLTEKYIWVE